jgi:hypothetical protein
VLVFVFFAAPSYFLYFTGEFFVRPLGHPSAIRTRPVCFQQFKVVIVQVKEGSKLVVNLVMVKISSVSKVNSTY